MVNYNLFVLHGYKNAKHQRFWCYELDFLKSGDVTIGHVTNVLAVVTLLSQAER